MGEQAILCYSSSQLKTDSGKQRMKIHDRDNQCGFVLAEEDLKMRGSVKLEPVNLGFQNRGGSGRRLSHSGRSKRLARS